MYLRDFFTSILANLYLLLRPRKIYVICYHRVNCSGDYFSMHTDEFAAQIKFLSKKFTIISFTQFEKIMNGLLKVRRPLLVTFDDGYADNYLEAFPVMKRYSLPFTIFLATGFVDQKKWMWEDIYRYLIMNTALDSLSVGIGSDELRLSFLSIQDRMKARRDVDAKCSTLSSEERYDFLQRLSQLLSVNIPKHPVAGYAPLTWDQIREMSANGVSFGAHTVHHQRMSTLSYDGALQEIFDSKATIEKEIKSEVACFAYPKGHKGDFNDQSVQALRTSGIRFGFTMVQGVNSRQTDPSRLRRISAIEGRESLLLAEVSGLSGLVAKFVQTCQAIKG